jgi:hypothetical protein
MEEILSDWEDRINFFTDHIQELESQLQYYQNLVAEKDSLINRLIEENNRLKSQGVVSEIPISVPSAPPQEIPHEVTIQNTIPPPKLHPPPNIDIPVELNPIGTNVNVSPSVPAVDIVNFDSGIRKRQCPNCGAQGFAIREVEDKSQLISFFPKVYAKKRVCIKCRNEF